MNELDALARAEDARRRAIERADAAVDAAILRAYRAEREDGTPQFTLAQIGATLGVTRQQAHRLVRRAAARTAQSQAGAA